MDSDTEHTLTVHLTGVRSWEDAERKAAEIIRRYFAIPARGRKAETTRQVLGAAEFKAATTSRRSTFDVEVTVTR